MDIWISGGTISTSNNYIATTATATQHAKYGFTKVADDIELKAATSANAVWIGANCWNFEGTVVLLKTWEQLSS
jgi:hypothetical protein